MSGPYPDNGRDAYEDSCASGTSGGCTNCGHAEPHTGPSGGSDDACIHPCCNCGFDSRGLVAASGTSPADPWAEVTRYTVDREGALEEDSLGDVMLVADVFRARQQDAADLREARAEVEPEIIVTLERLAATQRNMPVPLTVMERAIIRAAAQALKGRRAGQVETK